MKHDARSVALTPTFEAAPQPLVESLSEALRARVANCAVVEAGFAAGPGFAATNTRRFDPPVSLDVAFEYLERYRTTFRVARIDLEDGMRLMFDRSGVIGVLDPRPLTS